MLVGCWLVERKMDDGWLLLVGMEDCPTGSNTLDAWRGRRIASGIGTTSGSGDTIGSGIGITITYIMISVDEVFWSCRNRIEFRHSIFPFYQIDMT